MKNWMRTSKKIVFLRKTEEKTRGFDFHWTLIVKPLKCRTKIACRCPFAMDNFVFVFSVGTLFDTHWHEIACCVQVERLFAGMSSV